ncbi:MAG: hypothetical protein ACPGVE_05300 [Flavobacteriales bacterium]
MEVKTPIKVTKIYWNTVHTKSQITNVGLALEQNNISLKLAEIKQRVLNGLSHIPLIELTKTTLIHLVNNTYTDACKKETLTTSFATYINQNTSRLKTNTIKRYNFVKNCIILYEKQNNTVLNLTDINYNFKAVFISFCLEKNYAVSTIKRNIAAIKTVCFNAELRGKEVNTEFKKWKNTLKKPNNAQKPVYLSFKELETIEQLSLSCDSQTRARDWLIISCFTGQRFSDFMVFTSKAVYKENGKYYMAFTQQKTNKKMVIALHKKVIDILQRRNMQFPKAMSIEYYNSLLKTICKTAEIHIETYGAKRCKKTHKNKLGLYPKWQLVSSHIGRRSFATNFYGTIPTGLLKNATGHSTEKMLLQYIGKTDAEQAKQLHSYFE